MLLVICGLDDEGALWLTHRVRQSGADCTVVTTEALSYARHLSHRLARGEVRTEVRLADGTRLVDSEISGVLNRAVQPPGAAWQRAAPAERDYATVELHACTLSWLHALPCPVRNRPEPDCLAGPLRHPFVTVAAAHAAGLPCPEVRFDTAGPLGPADALLLAAARAAGPQARPVHLACLDGVVAGPVAAGPVVADPVVADPVVADSEPPAPVAAGIKAFATRLGAEQALIGVDFFAGAGGWWFAGTSPLPDLRAGGETLCQRLLALLAPGRLAARS